MGGPVLFSITYENNDLIISQTSFKFQWINFSYKEEIIRGAWRVLKHVKPSKHL